jgi:glycosyltransferase involved in cell wall biosynthesis
MYPVKPMNKKIVILVGGSGKLGLELTKFLSKRYEIHIIDKVIPKIKAKNIIFSNLDFVSDIKLFNHKIDNIFLRKKIKNNIHCVINLLRPNFSIKTKTLINTLGLNKMILNYANLIQLISKKVNNPINILNISTTNIKLISQQNFDYHYFKNSMELTTKYNSIKLLKKRIYSNSLRIGLIKTKNITKIVSTDRLKKILNLNQLIDHNSLFKFIEKVYINNDILNGTMLTLDNSVSNIDPLYFANDKKLK